MILPSGGVSGYPKSYNSKKKLKKNVLVMNVKFEFVFRLNHDNYPFFSFPHDGGQHPNIRHRHQILGIPLLQYFLPHLIKKY